MRVDHNTSDYNCDNTLNIQKRVTMAPFIQPIVLDLPFKIATVNSYLLRTDGGTILVDTGMANNRKVLVAALTSFGCGLNDLSLIILTHGDFDHTSNATYFRQMYGARIGMHPADAGMLETGNMFLNRKGNNPIKARLIPLLFGFGKSKRGSPDLSLLDGDRLDTFGLNATVIGLYGHSKGSIGVLLDDGSLLCGDLFENEGRPRLNSIMDDQPEAEQTLLRLKNMDIKKVYPGHGNPFDFSDLQL
jgi:glyoxylase-like metal-dependent hydrolase (beta-lactamase superfamily II)